MGHTAKVHLEVELPDDLARLTLPDGVERRLQALLDRQDQGDALTQDEREEAEAWRISLICSRCSSAVASVNPALKPGDDRRQLRPSRFPFERPSVGVDQPGRCAPLTIGDPLALCFVHGPLENGPAPLVVNVLRLRPLVHHVPRHRLPYFRT